MTLLDCRALLREGDALVKAYEHAAAVHVYAEAARAFDREGQTLKAVVVFAQVRTIIAEHRLVERERVLGAASRARMLDLEAELRARLPVLYRQLGLLAEAEAIEKK